MSHLHVCDQCDHTQSEPLTFRVRQAVDELDDDGDPVVVVLDICSAGCLSDFAMGLTLDFPEDAT